MKLNIKQFLTLALFISLAFLCCAQSANALTAIKPKQPKRYVEPKAVYKPTKKKKTTREKEIVQKYGTATPSPSPSLSPSPSPEVIPSPVPHLPVTPPKKFNIAYIFIGIGVLGFIAMLLLAFRSLKKRIEMERERDF